MERPRPWLAAVPGRDGLERRQAYLLQAVLFVVATVFFIATTGNALTNLPRGSTNGVFANLIAGLIALALVAVLRRGWFRLVAGLTAALLTLGFTLGLASAGPAVGGPFLALLLVPLVLAGLILPRWALLASTVGIYVAAELAVRYGPAAGTNDIPVSLSNFLYACVLVAVVVDQFGGVVRTALLDAIAREQELDRARSDLLTRTNELQTAVAALEAEIAERQRVEAERAAMQARVLEVQKLESLGVLAGGIAHDFNNLLVGIMGNAGLAQLELPPGTDGRERIAQIETAARRASDLARQMLAYSGKGRFVVAALDVSALVREMTQLLRASIDRRIEIKYALASDPVVIEGDATQLRQVVMNLVVNAADAIGDFDGAITVATSRVRADRAYLAGMFVDEGLEAGDYAVIDVSDTGAGMDPATQARIFDPFFTTKAAGRGLGLAAVLGIVRAHRGALKVYSEQGRGSTFKLLLPLTSADVSPDPWASRSPTPWQGDGTILVVDDEPMVRDVAQAILQRLGLAVVAAVDGEEAIAMFAAEPDRFAAVLLDLTMPRVSGAETFRRICEMRPGMPVILMSGYNEEEASGQFAGKGLAGFIEKPFSTQALADAIERVLGVRPPAAQQDAAAAADRPGE
jgi:signal transduction histidine kinase/CheY-like chemotaxis protein